MTISLNSTGPNSAMIEYSNDTWQNLMNLIDTFLTGHGWTQTKDTFVYSGMTGARVYEALDKDPATKKTMVVAYLNTGFLGTIIFESFNPAGTTGVNMAFYSGTIASPGYYCQVLNPTTQNGRLHLFATNHWFLMFNIGYSVGTAYGASFNGCVEFTKANEGDNTPNHAFVTGYYLAGEDAGGYYTVCPVKTFANTGGAAAYYNRICTPAGSWGYPTATSQKIMIPKNPPPFGTTLKHQVHDMSVAMDCLSTSQTYVKGKMYGIKVFTTSGAVSGDVFTAKCDSDFFLDLSGTDTDHFIIKNTEGACYGIPL